MTPLCAVAALLAAAILSGTSAQNMWSSKTPQGDDIEYVGDPSPGLSQRTCYQYYGHVPARRGKEWASVKCNAPFDHVCLLISGEAELEHYTFKQSYIRACHFRCPCPDEQPWVEWYKGYPTDEPSVRSQRHWEKQCFMQQPPTEYAVASTALPFKHHKPIHVRCCKKHWDWIGHPNDTRKHPRTPKFIEHYNRSVDVRIGYWGQEFPEAQPPVFLDPDYVMNGAENCNKWPDEDPMTPWDQTILYNDLGGSGATASIGYCWWAALVVLSLLQASFGEDLRF